MNYWPDTTLFYALLVVGTICFGRFEDWKPRWRRLLKIVMASLVFLALLWAGGRPLAWGVMSLMLVVVAWVHMVWLPRHGVNGWTAEPRERYLDLVDRRRRVGRAGLPVRSDADNI